MSLTTPAALAAKVTALANRWRTYTDQLTGWLGGVADGGPDGDGRYPLIDAEGVTHLVLCPAAQEALVSGPANSVNSLLTDALNMEERVTLAREAALQASEASSSYATTAAEWADLSRVYAETSGNNATTALTKALEATTAAQQALIAAAQVAEDRVVVEEGASTILAAADTAERAAVRASDSASSASLSANAPVDSVLPDGGYSARHWAAKASASASGTLVYQGSWDASIGYLPVFPVIGQFYKISAQGVISGVTYNVGDQIVFNGATWDLIDNSDLVQSVNGKVGKVELVASDVSGLSTALSKKVDSASPVITEGYLRIKPYGPSHTVSNGFMESYFSETSPVAGANWRLMARDGSSTLTPLNVDIVGQLNATVSLYSNMVIGETVRGGVLQSNGDVNAAGLYTTTGDGYQIRDTSGAIRGRIQHNGTNTYVASDVGDLVLRPAGYSSAAGQLRLLNTQVTTEPGIISSANIHVGKGNAFISVGANGEHIGGGIANFNSAGNQPQLGVFAGNGSGTGGALYLRPDGRTSAVGSTILSTTLASFSTPIRTGGPIDVNSGTDLYIQLNPSGGRAVRFASNNGMNSGLYDATNSQWMMRFDANSNANFQWGLNAPHVTTTHELTAPGHGGTGLRIYKGTGDSASWSTYNTMIQGWWGLAFSGYDAVPHILMDLRAGHIYGHGNASFEGIVGNASISCGAGIIMEPNGHIWVGDANNRASRRRQPRMFVQAADPGAAATDGDLWIW